MQDIVKPLQLHSTELAASRRSRESSRDVINQPPLFQNLLQRFPAKKYALRLPILAIGALCYAGSGFIFLTIEPRSIQHILLPNSYSPLVGLLAFGHFCTFSYLFLNSRRGAVISLVLSAIFFLRLQQVLTQEIVLQVVIGGIVIEVVYLVLRAILKLLQPHVIKLSDRLPKRTTHSRSHADQVAEEQATELLDHPSHPQRKRGRKRKHHFFGK